MQKEEQMTVRTMDREHEVDLASAARVGASVAMVTAFVAMFLVVLSQVGAVVTQALY